MKKWLAILIGSGAATLGSVLIFVAFTEALDPITPITSDSFTLCMGLLFGIPGICLVFFSAFCLGIFKWSLQKRLLLCLSYILCLLFLRNIVTFPEVLKKPLHESFLSEEYGTWVLEPYIDLVKTTRSPSKAIQAAIKLTGVQEIIIGKSLNGSSSNLEIGISLNNHEGGSCDVKNIARDGSIVLSTEQGCPGSLLIRDHILIATVGKRQWRYLKINSNWGPIAGEGINEVVWREIFSSKFHIPNINQSVQLDQNGHVEGLSNFHYYFVQTDFVSSGDDKDQICFGNSKAELENEKGTCFMFIVDNRSVRIYDNKDGKPGLLRWVIAR